MCHAVAVVATAWCCATPALAQITLDGGEVQVTMTTATSAFQGAPAVAWGPDGSYVVAWQQQSATAGGWDVVAQQFQINGGAPPTAPGPVLAASGPSTSFCRQSPAVAIDAAGDFVVVWASNEESAGLHGIFGQLYSSTGQAQGSRISVSTTAAYDDLVPTVAMTADGRFLVAWQANGPSGWSILARAFAGGMPVGN
ncbi:MAG TPA: hypothetical protein VN999_08130, partial [Thermoanaerobaculia bacterium]|nr:hypothetical protein [Thermoanaerobaculia bacterium]